MQRFNDDPIQNDTCADVPTLAPPTYQNVTKGQQGNDTPATESVDVDGVMVDISTGPHYDHGKMVARREQPLQNRSGENSDVPVLYGPCYE